MKKVIARKTVTLTISTSKELRDQIDARAAQLNRDRSSYFTWLAMKDLGLIPDETFDSKMLNAVLHALEERERIRRPPVDNALPQTFLAEQNRANPPGRIE